MSPGPTSRLATAQGVAFFDVDETLITAKSMFDFARHVSRSGHSLLGDDDGEYHAEVVDLTAMRLRGAGRAEMNRAYYRRYAGVPLARLQAACRDWYRSYRVRAEAFVTAGLQALARHQQAGHGVVLVSGSARPLLEPIAEDLGADLVLCTEQCVDSRGFLTGEVARPMIGEVKAEAATAVMTELGVRSADCFAYGDHASDADMLQAVGNPVVVGADPVLVRHARASGWPVLASSPGPRSALETTAPGPATQAHPVCSPGTSVTGDAS
jgi:HAD superfamily hydrolase (TIGR01490 family)